ncbi:MAG: zinc ribbon domain-containing protein [Lentisphaeria bacterium]|nr:zinc ribbon domain-containing protein [Lentisphaeria bacterium]
MPIFRYHCQHCEADFELLLPRFDSPAECPSCGANDPERQPSLIGAIAAGNKHNCASAGQCPAAGHCCSGSCGCGKH